MFVWLTVYITPRRRKISSFFGLLIRAITFGTLKSVLPQLRDDEIVLIVTRRGDQDIRAGDARFFKDRDLTPIAVQNDRAEPLAPCLDFRSVSLDQQDLVSLGHERLRQVIADLAAANDHDIHASAPLSIRSTRPVRSALCDLLAEQLRDGRGRADRFQAELGIGIRPLDIIDPREDLRHMEDRLRDLRRHDIGVVVVRDRDEGARALDTRAPQHILINPGAEDRPPAK